MSPISGNGFGLVRVLMMASHKDAHSQLHTLSLNAGIVIRTIGR